MLLRRGLAAEAEMELRIYSSWLSTLRCLIIVLLCTDSLPLLLALFSKFAQFADDVCTWRSNQFDQEAWMWKQSFVGRFNFVIDGLRSRSLIVEVFLEEVFLSQGFT